MMFTRVGEGRASLTQQSTSNRENKESQVTLVRAYLYSDTRSQLRHTQYCSHVIISEARPDCIFFSFKSLPNNSRQRYRVHRHL